MKKLIVIALLVLVCEDTAFASALGAYDAGAVNSRYIQDMRTHELVTRSRSKNAIVSTPGLKPENEIVDSNIKTVTFVNNVSIPSEELNLVIKDKMEKPMNAENISAIRKDIMKYYQSKGYFSAVAMVVSQNNKDGELVLEINEGGRNSIQFEE